MVLADSFYYQPVQIDTINTRVNADLFAKEGDANGRGMVVQITENGIIKDTTGITLRLQWSHISVGVSGFTDFEVVDAAKGLYKLQYPTSMLHRGRVEAFIRITDNGRLSGTRNLLITVERMVGSDETIEASDDFSALQTALTKLSAWEATISGLQGIDRTFGDVTYATLTALETAYPTGDTKRYIVAADGKWYYWSGSAWAAGQVAQAIGIVDKSQGLNQLSSDLSLANYPFTNPSVRKDLLKFGVVLDAVLIGADRTKAYTIGGLRKNFGGTNNTRIQVHEWDLTTGAWAGGSAAKAIRASWSKDNYVPAKTTEMVKLAAIGTSGFKVELLVDWTKIPDGISHSYEGGHFHYFHPNTISKGQTFLPNVFKSRQNIDKTFPDTAFYTGHWFKKTVNAKECISTNLFGAEINLIFKGTTISVDVEYVGYSASLYVAVDGVGSSWIDIASSGVKVLKSGLADTEHIITLWTQPSFGNTADASPFFSGKGSVNIVGFSVPTFPIYGSKRTLVFYGDSITAGQEDRFVGYAKRIEQFLPVNTIRVAQPSAPLVQRTDRPYIPTLTQFFNQSSNGLYARPMPADIVLTNIGTNDDSWLSSANFEAALTTLVNALKIRHGGAPICLISPFGGYRATETANVASATGVHLVDTTGWAYTTADGLHPDGAGATALALKLSTDLIAKFGFDFFNMI